MQTTVTMKTLLLLSLLAVGSASAEWVVVAESDSSTFYIDPSTVRKEGTLRKTWEVDNFKQREADGSMSSRMRIEYDCQGERTRGLALSKHSEPMAKGNTIVSYGEDRRGWREIPPNTPANDILKIVCAE